MTMMPPKNKISAPWPTPSNADARQGLGDQYDVVYEMNEAPELDIAAASTMDIGGQSSQRLRITSGAAVINSFGTNYRGPIYLRSAVSATIKNGPYIVCPGGVDLSIVAGDTLMTWPKATGGVPDGWQITTVGKIAASIIPSGTVMLFAQATAPVGWTQITTHNDKALRIVSGAGGGSGGSVDFGAAFTSQPVTGSNSATTLTIAQMPAHSHAHGTDDNFLETLAGGGNGMAIARSGKPYPPTGSTGGGNSHNHTFTGTAINLAVKYVNTILASKD